MTESINDIEGYSISQIYRVLFACASVNIS